MTPSEKLHTHHEKLIGTIRSLSERAIIDHAETSLFLSYCTEYLLAHAQAEEVTLYKAETDEAFVNNMVHEHREIEHSLDVIAKSYERGDSASLEPEIKNFTALLNKHFMEEEERLMPGLMKKISEQELEALIAEAHKIEADNKKSDIWQLFENDHRRVDINVSRTRTSAADFESAKKYYSKFRAQLLKHIELEETVLFPAFGEHAAPQQMGPVQAMIAEHREITSLISTGASSVDPKTLGVAVDALIAKLAVHNKKEELILYPLINRTLSPEERSRIFKECLEGFTKV